MESSRICPRCGRPVPMGWCSYGMDLSPGGRKKPPEKHLPLDVDVEDFTDLGEYGGIPERGGMFHWNTTAR